MSEVVFFPSRTMKGMAMFLIFSLGPCVLGNLYSLKQEVKENMEIIVLTECFINAYLPVTTASSVLSHLNSVEADSCVWGSKKSLIHSEFVHSRL